ncbi:flavin oxidoreductase [Thalassotalea sp. M1531]|uniref:Flavin oxidoreductase n=1 Tax=Thalassotalea algicola TaxID=2716224 RepID=A0A7Y0L9E2_9GAMM|nr:flavin reductase [Thalassotalea algicola]NMP30399.1 flavin oxidoreductase [Thalassotalea algicola]
MPSRYRAQLVNSLSGFKSANLIATCNADGQTNVAIFSSVVHLGASPALVGFVMRPNNVARHTLENIKQTKQYTINQVSESFWLKAHQTSARYVAQESEFDLCGLSSRYYEGIDAPFVNESQLQYALTLKEIIPIELNNTLLVIGEVTDVFCQNMAIKPDGYIDIESLNTVSISGLDSYHVSRRLSRLSYAKPERSVQRIPVNGQNELSDL